MAEVGLREALEALDGRSYGDYRRVGRRTWSLSPIELTIEHVQGDPFAAPSRVRLDLDSEALLLPDFALAGPAACRASADFLHRLLAGALRSARPPKPQGDARGRGRNGSGGSGTVEIARVGQEVLARTAVVIDPDGAARVRLTVGLPAAGRRILGRAAGELLAERLPRLVLDVVGSERVDLEALRAHVEAVEDQVALRAGLVERGLVAFLAEGAILARSSGVDDRPLAVARALAVPASLAVELDTPHRGRVRGMGIRDGVTLIAGGGYHGKSTLLDALARSVYDHVPGDGREVCVTREDAVCIRAEDGRSVRGVDLRPFIGRLPLDRSTESFDTDDASGSTSQAAAIVEALEAGAGVFLIDEDTAATNFMIRDARMRRLVPAGREPITPFLDRVRSLSDECHVSSVLVVGGAGDYLDVADAVVLMDTYAPTDATAAARSVAMALPLVDDAAPRSADPWMAPVPRRPRPQSFDPRRGRKEERVRSRSTRAIEFGSEEIDLSLVAQLVDPGQCRLIGDVLLDLSRGRCDGSASLAELLDQFEEACLVSGIEAVAETSFGDRAGVRRFEIAAAINRLRSLRIDR
ncbi:MAG: ABC-ATPase domain-containing protein [Candidatus Binatia bacterium]|nr:ABC-ATPase domain-containing protein [Candidatus Binatia bacterium]